MIASADFLARDQIKNHNLDSSDESIALDASIRKHKYWRELQKKCPNANWLQAWPWAHALWVRDKFRNEILNITENEKTLGMCSVNIFTFLFYKKIQIFRGPLWTTNAITPSRFDSFCKALNKRYPKSFFHRRKWLIELEKKQQDVEVYEQILAQNGFKKTTGSYSTIWIDIYNNSEESLRAQLHQKWRNSLNRAQRYQKAGDLKIQFEALNPDTNLQRLVKFLNPYESYKKEKQFRGPSVAFLAEALKQLVAFGDGYFLWAESEGSLVAGMLFEKHGANVSYRVGWNSEEGRKLGAHNVMIWEAMLEFKRHKLQRLDLGGILPGDAPGLSAFKRGIGGCEVELLGIYE